MLILVSKFEGRKGRHCNGGPLEAQPPYATVRKGSQKSTVKDEDPVRKFLWANAHFIRNSWCSLLLYLVWERRSHISYFSTTPLFVITYFCFTLLRTVISVHGQRQFCNQLKLSLCPDAIS